VATVGTVSALEELFALPWSASSVKVAVPRDDIATSDERLMADYRGGDASAFQKLYLRHCDRLHRFILRMAVSTEAEEIFQEVWMAVVRGRERYAPTARFTTYLYSIAHRRSVDRMRAQWRAAEALELREGGIAESDEFSEAAAGQPPAVAWRASVGAALLAAIAALPAPQREAFLLQAEGELSLEEIAEATATSRETVKSRLRYANRRLRDALAEWR
jgi:RNA polymerase sigma-70 factor (ECF subfamily)